MPSSQQHSRICILGAGPAGLAAGIRLSQLGLPFTIIDKEHFPRDKVCGDGLSGKSLALPMKLVIEKKVSLQKLLPDLIGKYPHLSRRFERAVMAGKPRAQRLPFYEGRQPVSSDHCMLLGDAARIVDPFTGEGIANAMLSGMLAAETAGKAVNALDFSESTLNAYDNLLYAKLEKELTLAMRLQKLAANAWLINLLIGRASKNKKIRYLLKDIVFGVNAMKELGKPIFYVKLMLGME